MKETSHGVWCHRLTQEESQIRIVTETGEIIDRRIATTRDRFTATFWGRPRMRILLEIEIVRFADVLSDPVYLVNDGIVAFDC